MTASPSAPLREIAPGLLVRSAAALPPLGHFRLIAFDMDSTLINIECVDEIAAAAGRGAEVAAITEAAMRGEITDFKESLRRRVALLQGVGEAQLERVWQERLRPSPTSATPAAPRTRLMSTEKTVSTIDVPHPRRRGRSSRLRRVLSEC